jgi:hypothetical protein
VDPSLLSYFKQRIDNERKSNDRYNRPSMAWPTNHTARSTDLCVCLKDSPIQNYIERRQWLGNRELREADKNQERQCAFLSMEYLNKVNNVATVSLCMKNWVRIPTDTFLVSRIRTGMMRPRMGKHTLICSTVRRQSPHLRVPNKCGQGTL